MSNKFNLIVKTVETTEEKVRDPKEEKRIREIKRCERLKLASYCPKKSGQSWSHIAK